VPRLTIAGGFGKLAKLAQGHLDLHSGRSQVSLEALSALVPDHSLAERVARANTALEALRLAEDAVLPLGDVVADGARRVAEEVLRGAPVRVDVLVVDRSGTVVGRG
jgi:cobalt-precorrin-5B (C1)-methyltransferase